MKKIGYIKSLLFLLFIISGCAIIMDDFFNKNGINSNDLKKIVFLNEISASSFENDDWIELYNSHPDNINLSEFYLKYNSEAPVIWKFPSNTIIAGESFLVITCNGTNHGLNTNFILNTGKDIQLLSPDKTEVIDVIEYIPFTGEGSYGRENNGDDNWIFFEENTKGRSNQ